MKAAIVYDRVNKWGGAERVLLALHEIFPKAPLYTSVYDSKNALWAKVFPKVFTSFLQKIPFAKTNHEFLAPLMPLAFSRFDFSNYDIVISVTSEFAKNITTYGKTLHICYCLTPTRYLWSHKKHYFANNIFNSVSKPVVKRLQIADIRASIKPDVFVAISTEIKDRIKKYYKRDSKIIFPPVNTSLLYSNEVKKKGEDYLIVSRLVGYKKVDLAVKAFNKLGKPLIIIGTGRAENHLKKIAKKNITFAGFVTEKKLTEYYSAASALVMPQEEDFGIVAVEAQAHGVPVIAFKKGGACDTVIPDKTGVFFSKQNVVSLVSAVQKFEKIKFQKRTLLSNANKFSKERFKKEFVDFLKNVRMS